MLNAAVLVAASHNGYALIPGSLIADIQRHTTAGEKCAFLSCLCGFSEFAGESQWETGYWTFRWLFLVTEQSFSFVLPGVTN